MKYNIIGDIHGRNIWKQLVCEDAINIFLGDYLDPYPREGIMDDMAWENFVDILRYRSSHSSSTILLWGNHDLHYLFPEEHYSRYNTQNARRMRELYEAGALTDLQLSYCIGGHTLITHAGVTREWWQMVCRLTQQEMPVTPDAVSALLRILAQGSPELLERVLGAEATFAPSDVSGDSPTASPIWVRPQTLLTHNLFAGSEFKQIVGHTQIAEPITVAGITFADCLAHSPQSYLVGG